MPFAKMPIEVFLDHRLTLKQIRVLGAILSFAGSDGQAHPKRKAISERCGMTKENVSRATTQLCELGWLTKVGAGGYSMPSSYQVTVPDFTKTVPETDTVEQCPNQTPLDENNGVRIGHETVYESDTKTVYESDTRKEQTIEQTINRPMPEPLVIASLEEQKPKPKKQNNPITLTTFFANCAAKGELPIPDNDPIFADSAKTRVPPEFLELCWLEFKDIHVKNGKRQKDWRATFRNCVRSEWYKLWYTDENGNVLLTSRGRAAQLRHRSAA